MALPPTVLPHLLLSGPRNPRELLERALQLRESPEGRLYREWHARLRAAWSQGRRSPEEDDAEVVRREIEARLRSRAEGASIWATKLDVEVEAGFSVGGEVPVGVPNKLRSWLVDAFKFRGHRKLLLRMSLDQHAFDNVGRGLRELWMKG